MSDALLRFENVTKSYGDFTVFSDISLEVHEKEVVSIIGSSGSGKTTLLRCINLLEPFEAGKIILDGQEIGYHDVNGKRKRVPEKVIAQQRSMTGMVFQQFNLFPHMTAKKNVMLGLTHTKKMPKAEAEALAEKWLTAVGLGDKMDNLPSELSGGQQQRVAIARTLAPEPTVLFMDEPLSNLDAKLRLEMRYELQRLHVETGSTFVYVTHDQMEAMTLATQICLINNGVLQQYQAPLEVYHHPANLFVADFVGNPSINFVEAKGAQAQDGSIDLTVLGGLKAKFRPAKSMQLADWFAARDEQAANRAAALKEKASQKGYVEKGNKDEVFRYHIAKVNEEDDSLAELPEITNEDFVLGIRPEFIDIADEGKLRGEIYGAMPTGMESTIKVRVGGFLLTGVVFGSSLFTIGAEVPLSVTGDQIMLFDRKSGQCITSGSLTF